MASFNMTTWTQVAINSYLYESSAAAVGVDYVLSINMPSADIFTSAHYKQNSVSQLYDVRFGLNTNNLKNKLLANNEVSISSDLNGFANFTTPTTAGKALLEVMARKIFRHPKAAAAIANDHKYTGNANDDLSGLIASGLGGTFNKTVEGLEALDETAGTYERDLQNLFESYVSLGRVNNADDISGYQQMVFQTGDKFTFPFYLKGRLYDDDSDGNNLPLISTGYYVDTVNDSGIGTGKDNGIGFISPGTFLLSGTSVTPKSGVRPNILLGNKGEYEVPIRLEINIE